MPRLTIYRDRELTPKCKYHLGERVAGWRCPYRHEGVITKAYYTVNGNWLNPAYLLLCDDGRIRSFQQLYKLPCERGIKKT